MKNSTVDLEIEPTNQTAFETDVQDAVEDEYTDEEYTVPTMHLADHEPYRAYVRELPPVAVPAEVVAWARGCKVCTYGLVGAPTPHGRASLFTERTAQAHAGMLVFCTCRAGIASQRYYGGN